MRTRLTTPPPLQPSTTKNDDKNTLRRMSDDPDESNPTEKGKNSYVDDEATETPVSAHGRKKRAVHNEDSPSISKQQHYGRHIFNTILEGHVINVVSLQNTHRGAQQSSLVSALSGDDTSVGNWSKVVQEIFNSDIQQHKTLYNQTAALENKHKCLLLRTKTLQGMVFEKEFKHVWPQHCAKFKEQIPDLAKEHKGIKGDWESYMHVTFGASKNLVLRARSTYEIMQLYPAFLFTTAPLTYFCDSNGKYLQEYLEKNRMAYQQLVDKVLEINTVSIFSVFLIIIRLKSFLQYLRFDRCLFHYLQRSFIPQ